MQISFSISFTSICIFITATTYGANAQTKDTGAALGERDGQTPQYQIYKIGFMQEAWNNNSKAIVCMHRGQYQQAIELLRGALKIDNNYVDARNNLAIALNNHALDIAPNDNDGAIDLLQEACKIKPENRMYRDNLQKALRRKAESASEASPASEKLKLLREASMLNPDNYNVDENLRAAESEK